MDYFNSCLVFLLIGVVASEWTTEDGKAKAVLCYQQVMRYGDITNLLIDVTTPDAIHKFCRLHSDYLKCIRDNEHFMTVQEDAAYQANISGVNNFYIQVCPPGSDITADYEENAACFKQIANRILYCGSDLPEVNTYRMKNDIHFRCCALEQHRECVKIATEEKCGNAAADVAEKILLRYFNRQLKPCNTPADGCEYRGRRTTVLDWGTTAHKRGESRTTKWDYYSTKDGGNHKSEQERRRTTEAESEDWGHPTEEGVWKKHKKHSGAIATTLNSISILGCLVALLVHNHK